MYWRMTRRYKKASVGGGEGGDFVMLAFRCKGFDLWEDMVLDANFHFLLYL